MINNFIPVLSERIMIMSFLRWYVRNAGVEVNSGERRVISSVALEAEDLDTPTDQVYYFLNSEPRFGKLQLKVSGPSREPVIGCVWTCQCCAASEPCDRSADGGGLARAVIRSELHSGRRGDEPSVVRTHRCHQHCRVQRSRQLPLYTQRPGQQDSSSELLHFSPHCAERSEVKPTVALILVFLFKHDITLSLHTETTETQPHFELNANMKHPDLQV